MKQQECRFHHDYNGKTLYIREYIPSGYIDNPKENPRMYYGNRSDKHIVGKKIKYKRKWIKVGWLCSDCNEIVHLKKD